MKTHSLIIAITAVAVLLCGCSKVSGAEVSGAEVSGEDSQTGDSLTVYTLASYNVKCDNGASGDQSWSGCRKNLVPAVIRDRSFDICGLNEVSQPTVSTDLKTALSDEYSFYSCGRNNGGSSGEAVAICYKTSKFNVVSSGYFFLNTHPDTAGEADEWRIREEKFGRSRIAVWIHFEDKTEGTRFLFIATHFELDAGMRQGSADLIISKAQSLVPSGTPVFFCGDLNAHPDETNSIGRLSNYFTDSYLEAVREGLPREGEETTYNGFDQYVGKKLSNKRIDYMFYRGNNIVLKKYGVIYDLIDGKLPSDHYPIYVNVSFKPED